MEPRTRVALYARPAVNAEGSGAQLHRLRCVAAERGWLVVVEAVDRSPDRKAGRPEAERVLALVRRGALDVVLVARLHLLARSVSGLVEALDELHGRGVHAAALDGFDSATAAPP